MIRFIIVCVTVVGFLILSIPLLIAEWILGRFNPYAKDISSLRIVQAVFKFIVWETGVKLDVTGEENIPEGVPVLYIGNHRSFFDVVITYARTPGLCGYISKIEFAKFPLLSNWMRYLHCLFLDRSDIRQGLQIILTAIEKIKSGISICVFPEGTRNRNASDLDLMEFHEGTFKIASRTNCPIIPMAISNSQEIFEAHFPRITKTHVILEYGKPIYPDQLDKEQKKHLGAYTQQVIHDMLKKNAADI